MKTMQRNALCSMNSQTFHGAGTGLARVRWTANCYSTSLRDGALRYLCKRDSRWGGCQCNALCSVISQTSWRWNKRSASLLDGALCKRDRGWERTFCSLRGRFCTWALPIPKEGPLGTISVLFNTCNTEQENVHPLAHRVVHVWEHS